MTWTKALHHDRAAEKILQSCGPLLVLFLVISGVAHIRITKVQEFSGAALLAGMQWDPRKSFGRIKILAVGRLLFAIAAAILGLLRFVHPAFANRVVSYSTETPFPPTEPIWSYCMGTAFLAAGAAIFLSSKARLAATLTGGLMLLFGLVVWVPWLSAHPQDHACGNYLKDMGLAGGVLLLAGALSKGKGEG